MRTDNAKGKFRDGRAEIEINVSLHMTNSQMDEAVSDVGAVMEHTTPGDAVVPDAVPLVVDPIVDLLAQTDAAVDNANIAMEHLKPGTSVILDPVFPVVDALSTATIPAKYETLLQNIKAFTTLMDKVSEVSKCEPQMTAYVTHVFFVGPSLCEDGLECAVCRP